MYYTIVEAAEIIGLSEDWVRRSIKSGRYPATFEGGVWRIAPDTLARWQEDFNRKEKRRLARLRDPNFYRPSRHAVRMVSRKVRKDETLTDEQRELFLQRLETYRDEWDERARCRADAKSSSSSD